MKKAYVLGVGMTRFGRRPDTPMEQMGVEAVRIDEPFETPLTPVSAVHTTAAEETQLTDGSGVFMRALAAELAHRGLLVARFAQ